MPTKPLIDAALDMAWSAWSELGVPGVSRNHQHVALDPEPLIIYSPALFEFDARLRDQVYAWCSAHSDRISASRLTGLAKELSSHQAGSFASFSATMRESGVRWPLSGDAESWRRTPNVDAPALPLHRPALVRLRLRALCGVGARADVLAELLGRHERVKAVQLESLGYSKRNIASILSELADAGIASRIEEVNAFHYALVRSPELAQLVGGDKLVYPRWQALWVVISGALELAASTERSPAVRRVEAHKLAERLRKPARIAEIEGPPQTTGDANAWDSVLEWAATALRGLADGSAAPFRPTWPKGT